VPAHSQSLRAIVDVPCFVGADLYAKLSKKFACAGFPTDGMRIGFRCRQVRAGKDADNYKRLVNAAHDSTGIVLVESWVYCPEAKAGSDSIMIIGMPCSNSTESKVAAYVALMRDYYGFSTETF
jgi:hypothetical protein